MGLPYENTTSGKGAIDEIQRILKKFECQSFGYMEDFENKKLLVQFKYRNVPISLEASMAGYAAAWLKEHPYNYRTRGAQKDHEKRALKIASTAVYSVLRDWIKGQVTAVECGFLSFEGAFLGQILLPSGGTVLQHVQQSNLLMIGNSNG